MTKYFGAVEAGGTKFKCAVINEQREIIAQTRIPTTSPEATLREVGDFFKLHKKSIGEYEALGIASFGPLDLQPRSSTYGYITKTPKPGWSGTNIILPLENILECPVILDTDVNGAALAEYHWGAGKKENIVIYITVGTGVGGGVVINGQPLHGLIHPEIGHILLPGHPDITCTCPFHSNCAEGLVSGTAIRKIWGQSAEDIEEKHEAWDIITLVLSQLCHNLLVTFSPQKIIMGGGVLASNRLINTIVEKTERSLGGYLSRPISASLSKIIVPTGLTEDSGLLGAFALAQSRPHSI
ncbi:ROK family protein [Glaciecola sp. 1036]|uniref:ROK family protein n=1 Tax=Alteromonadaceae TaxID=72275 RepID=UPI003D01F6D1